MIRADHGVRAGHRRGGPSYRPAAARSGADLYGCAAVRPRRLPDVYGDAVQTFNPAYPPHEFPAYERVPVSATVHVENLWDTVLGSAVVTETLAPGYLLTGTVRPRPSPRPRRRRYARSSGLGGAIGPRGADA